MTKKFTQNHPSPFTSLKSKHNAFQVNESNQSIKFPINSVAQANKKFKSLEDFSMPNFAINDFSTKRALQDFDQI